MIALLTSVMVIGIFIYALGSRQPEKFESVVLINSIGCKSAPTQTVGTVVAKNIVLTVAHGVAGQVANSITTIDGSVIQAKIVAIDTELDLALLYIGADKGGESLVPIVLGSAKANSKAKFISFTDDEQVTQTAKVIRRLRINTQDIYLKEKVSRPGLEIDAHVVVGNSGGPIINDKNEIVGIVWATSRSIQNRSWATRVEAANDMLNLLSMSNPESTTPEVVACFR